MNKKIVIGLVAGTVIFGGALAAGARMNDDSKGKQQHQVVKMVTVDQKAENELFSRGKQNDDWAGDDKGKDDSANITTPNKAGLTAEEAAAIAAKEVNGMVREIELEEEHGQLIFKVEFLTNKGKAEVEIDAATGKVLKVEHDN